MSAMVKERSMDETYQHYGLGTAGSVVVDAGGIVALGDGRVEVLDEVVPPSLLSLGI